MRISGVINVHVVHGVLEEIVVRSSVDKFWRFSDFELTRHWVCSHYQRMKLSQRASTTSRATITWHLWEEIKALFLQDVATAVRTYPIPDELVLNADQTPSKYVAISNVTIVETGAKHTCIAGGSDKRAITFTIVQSLTGVMLPYQ